MKKFGLPADRVKALTGHLMKKGEVYAPVAKGKGFVFDRIADAALAVIDYPSTLLPPKKLFQPQRETLFHFARSTGEVKEATESAEETKILLGIHNYDMAGILCMDYIMGRGNADESWATRRKGWVFVGVSYTPDKYHFSRSVGIPVDGRAGLDLFLEKVDGGFNIEALSPAGKKLLEGCPDLGAELNAEAPKPVFQNKLLPNYQQLPTLLAKAHEHPTWKKNAERCFSCGSCTAVCPTCYCFDVHDDLDLDLEQGKRVRKWDSCQVVPFTEVAGGEVFRSQPAARVQHRVYRKFKYITEHYGKPFCVGCGRCGRACTAGISITQMVNDIAREQNV